MTWLTGSAALLGIVAAKATLIYLTAVFGLRLGERRALARWTVTDAAAAVAIGAIIGRTAVADTQSYLTGATALVTIITAHRLINIARFHPRIATRVGELPRKCAVILLEPLVEPQPGIRGPSESATNDVVVNRNQPRARPGQQLPGGDPADAVGFLQQTPGPIGVPTILKQFLSITSMPPCRSDGLNCSTTGIVRLFGGGSNKQPVRSTRRDDAGNRFGSGAGHRVLGRPRR